MNRDLNDRWEDFEIEGLGDYLEEEYVEEEQGDLLDDMSKMVISETCRYDEEEEEEDE